MRLNTLELPGKIEKEIYAKVRLAVVLGSRPCIRFNHKGKGDFFGWYWLGFGWIEQVVGLFYEQTTLF